MAETTGQIVKRIYDCYLRGDLDGVYERFVDEAVWYDHGDNARAGIYTGKAAIAAHTIQIAALTDGTLSTSVQEILDGDEYAAVVEMATGRRHGRALNLKICTLWHSRAGKIIDLHTLPLDRSAWDEFWA
jgi:uncharacterized protein